MPNTKKNLRDIPEEVIHNNTTHRKRLISFDEDHRGDIATMNYAWLTPGSMLETHKHEDGEEFYYFLEGRAEMLVGDDWFPVESGDFVTVPQHASHSVRNASEIPVRFITVRTVLRPPNG